MSLYTEWINSIKAKATSEWLTKAQERCVQDLLSKWQASPFVCLCGPPGSGKSFVARLMAKEHGYVYATDLREVEPGPHQVILDGMEYDRLLRPVAVDLGLQRVITVMRRPPRDSMPVTEIHLTKVDVRQFLSNLTKHHILTSFKTEPEGTDLAQILRAEAIHRGTNDGTQ